MEQIQPDPRYHFSALMHFGFQGGPSLGPILPSIKTESIQGKYFLFLRENIPVF